MLSEVRNPVLRDYLRQYREIYDSFTGQVELFGLPFAPGREDEIAALRAELKRCGIRERNRGRASYTANSAAPAMPAGRAWEAIRGSCR